ncbi:hypothetical protein FHT85_004985 [Rhizobium sp. BK312]|uniref:hypothetical protein n=1 Tax=Rhizobium sp. BK312 TaxID=2587080 RepID=UPI000DDBC626|nr:hypothetical protein [Rhizobium sp. BK312]MBB3427976.1 hypothetical protein [Rhizobium sp. BK312]
MDLDNLSASSDALSLAENAAGATAGDARPADYANFEAETLAAAFRAAVKVPDHTWRLWAVMAVHFKEMNAHFTSAGEPQLKVMPYGRFRDLVWATVGRAEDSHA